MSGIGNRALNVLGADSLLQIGNTLQSIAQNITSAVTVLKRLVPNLSSGQLSADALIQTGFVRVLGISVVVKVAVPGFLHDAAVLANAAPANAIYNIPGVAGYIATQMVFTKGLVYKVAAGEKITVFYSRS